MADWTVIHDSQLDPDSPLTSDMAFAMRDNPIAIAQGSEGAPRITLGAISIPAQNTMENTAVNSTINKLATQPAGSVGSLAFARLAESTNDILAFGQTTSGSNLEPCSAAGVTTSTNPLSGTWRCLGYADSRNIENSATLWIRVS